MENKAIDVVMKAIREAGRTRESLKAEGKRAGKPEAVHGVREGWEGWGSRSPTHLGCLCVILSVMYSDCSI